MSFIIKKPEISNRTIRMPNPLIEKMGRIAETQSISFNQLVIQCCEYALEHLSEQQKETN